MNQGMTGSQDHARAVDLGPGGLIPTLETQTAQPQKKKRWPQNNADYYSILYYKYNTSAIFICQVPVISSGLLHRRL